MFDINKCKVDDKGHMWAQTKDGRKVRILCKDGPAMVDEVPQPIVGFADGCDTSDNWCIDGRFNLHPPNDEYDLVNIPEKHVVWVNVYRDDRKVGFMFGSERASKESCDNDHFVGGRVACIKVEFTEGEGL